MEMMYSEEHEHIAYHIHTYEAPRQQQPVMQPPSSPPSTTPQMPMSAQAGTQAVDPFAIRGCLYRYTYIWMKGGNRFWFWPVFVGRRSVSGFRWTGRRWVYTGIDLNRIEMFTC